MGLCLNIFVLVRPPGAPWKLFNSKRGSQPQTFVNRCFVKCLHKVIILHRSWFSTKQNDSEICAHLCIYLHLVRIIYFQSNSRSLFILSHPSFVERCYNRASGFPLPTTYIGPALVNIHFQKSVEVNLESTWEPGTRRRHYYKRQSVINLIRAVRERKGERDRQTETTVQTDIHTNL